MPSSSCSNVQCSHDALSVGSTRSACGARPTTNGRERGTGRTRPTSRPPASVTVHPSVVRGRISGVRAMRDPSSRTRSRSGVSALVVWASTANVAPGSRTCPIAAWTSCPRLDASAQPSTSTVSTRSSSSITTRMRVRSCRRSSVQRPVVPDVSVPDVSGNHTNVDVEAAAGRSPRACADEASTVARVPSACGSRSPVPDRRGRRRRPAMPIARASVTVCGCDAPRGTDGVYQGDHGVVTARVGCRRPPPRTAGHR